MKTEPLASTVLIEDDPARPHWLLTEIGVGYRFADEG